MPLLTGPLGLFRKLQDAARQDVVLPGDFFGRLALTRRRIEDHDGRRAAVVLAQDADDELAVLGEELRLVDAAFAVVRGVEVELPLLRVCGERLAAETCQAPRDVELVLVRPLLDERLGGIFGRRSGLPECAQGNGGYESRKQGRDDALHGNLLRSRAFDSKDGTELSPSDFQMLLYTILEKSQVHFPLLYRGKIGFCPTILHEPHLEFLRYAGKFENISLTIDTQLIVGSEGLVRFRSG
jgi:hypothetical protein